MRLMRTDIDEIARYLRTYAPNKINELVAIHPETRVYFESSGYKLGGAEIDPASNVASSMLDSVDEVATKAMSSTLAGLRSARRLELAGSLLALVASGGVVGALLGAENELIATILGAVGFVASAIPLVSSWIRTPAAGEKSVDQCFVSLRDLTWEARVLRAELTRPVDDPERANIVIRINDVAKQIYMVLSDLGYSPTFRPL